MHHAVFLFPLLPASVQRSTSTPGDTQFGKYHIPTSQSVTSHDPPQIHAKTISEGIAEPDAMAHLVLLGQSLTVLGLKSLQHESLDSLEQRLCQIDPSIITHSHILHTYIAWLGARIRVLDDSDSAALRAEISRWCTSLSALRLDKDLALSGFLQWKREQLALKPINARIFTLAGLEIQQAFRGPDLSSHSEAGSSMSSPHGTRPVLTEPEPEPEPDNPFAHMHPSRIPNLDQHTKPRIPVIDLETWPSPVVDLCSDNSDQDQPAPPPKTDEKPSFLTGANGIPASKSQTSIVVQDVKKSKKKSQKQRKKAQKMLLLAKDQQSTPGQPARDEQLQERSLNQEPETPRKHEPRPSQQQKENHVTATPDKMTPLSLLGSDGCPPKDPPKNYVCRRCGVRGIVTCFSQRREPVSLLIGQDTSKEIALRALTRHTTPLLPQIFRVAFATPRGRTSLRYVRETCLQTLSPSGAGEPS